MALQPVADLFNHTDLQGQPPPSRSSSTESTDAAQGNSTSTSPDDKRGCHVSYDDGGFTITTSRPYETGEELHICYGQHGNDFLLVEYGFLLTSNRWDEVRLDEVILPLLEARWDSSTGRKGQSQGNIDKEKKRKRRRRSSEGPATRNGATKESQAREYGHTTPITRAQALQEKGFLGNYILDTEAVCYRTEVALRALCMEEEAWRRFVDEGVEDDGHEGSQIQSAYDDTLAKILREFEKAALEKIVTLKRLGARGDNVPEARETLLRRWKQILQLVQEATRRI